VLNTNNAVNLTNIPAGQLTGSVPSAILTSVPAGNLTGSVPSATLTSVPAASLTGAVPSATLTSVPAANLTGSVPSGTLPANLQALNTNNGINLTNLQSTNLNNINVLPFLVSPMTGLSAYVEANSVVAAANTVFVVPLIISWPTFITNVCFTIATASGGGFVGISIYNSSGSKVLDTGPQSTTTAGTFHPVMTNTLNAIGQTLQPGTYYVGWNCNNATTAKFVSVPGTALLAAVVNANSPIILEGTSGTAASAGQNPSSLGTLTAANVAEILFCVFQ
jgi:hypothetical protein